MLAQNKPYKILSIDGGGIRGLIPALVLAEIEKRTGKPISELFDLMAGTSTGGILTLGLNIPNENGKARYTAQDLVNLFRNNGRQIFSKNGWRSIMTGLGILDEKYSHRSFEKLLDEYCGDVELKSVLTEVLITSYDLENTRKPFFFKSRLAREQEAQNFKIKSIIRATTAAPTYFEPLKLLSMVDPTTYYSLVDGGIVANNPAMCAFAEALVLNQSNVLMVSLGTGAKTEEIKHQDAIHWGLVHWIRPLIMLMMSGNSEAVNYQLREIFLAREGNDYYRIQIKLPMNNPAIHRLDNTTKKNFQQLEQLAKELIASENKKIDDICQKLS
jgi:patatin-like phospholipase/acyl hydrolase